MSLRTTVLPLGFGLSAVLCVSTAPADDDPAAPKRPPARVYTNDDLDRVQPFRDETGVRSVPAVAPGRPSARETSRERRGSDRSTLRPGRGLLAAGGRRASATGCARWRPRPTSCALRIAERAEEASRQLTRGRRGSSRSGLAPPTLRAPARRPRAAHARARGRPRPSAPAATARCPGWLR